MEYSVSSLSYIGPKLKKMTELPLDFGIEIFWDWGDEEYYRGLLPAILRNRSGAFSIHGPMSAVSFADDCSDQELFERLKRPFNLYHHFDSRFYVLHTHTNLILSANPSLHEIHSKRAKSIDRINRFDEICRSEGVQLVIENIGKTSSGVTMFDHEDFLELFRQNEKLCCLLDIGHAVLGDYNITAIQKELKKRLIAYHLHDNHGTEDEHLRMRKGIVDWGSWKNGCLRYTPEAEVVFEYNDVSIPEMYVEDRNTIQK